MKLFLFNNDEKLIGTVSPLEGIQNEEINKIQTIECTTVYSELIEKASYIGHKDYSDNRIFHLYKIDHVTKTSTTDVKIVGVHTFFDDMESDGYVKDFRPTNRELVGVLTTILDGSRWQLGTVNIQRRYTGNFYYVTRKEALSKLIEATQIEIKPRLEFSRGKITGRYLDVFTRLGARNGKVFIHGRDLLTVSEKKSQGAIYTAVVGRGKGEETDTGGYGRRISFKDVEWRRTSGQPVDKPAGQEYVEIPAMTELYGFERGTKPRIKIVEFQDETDKEKLLRLSYEWLEKNSRMQVEYSAKVLNVGNLELGDTVGIFNPKIGIKYETRVFKVKRNLVDNKLTEFGIGDKVTTSPFSRTIELAKEMKNFQDDTVYWLDKIRERLSDKLINEDGYNYDLKADNEYKVPAGYYSFDKPIDQNPTKVVYMGAGKIAIANSKKPTGEWNWKTFLDGTGATLDLINTGVLKAGRIQSADGRSYWDLDTGEFHMEQSAINEAVKTAVSGKVQEIVGEVKKNLPTKEELKGKSSYLHKKYSDYADGRNMSDNSNLKYIGIYTGDKQQAPTNASDYSWTKIRGEDGARGRDGNNGRDGVSNYIHRKYSDYSSGYAMDDNSSRKYIGIYTGTSSTPPTTPTSYTWSKIKGEDGRQGVPGVRGADGRTSYLHTAYANSPTGDVDFSTTNSNGKEYIGTYSDFEVADSTDYRRYKWVKIKGENGERGRDGVDGKDGDVGLNLLKGTKEFITSYFAPPDSWQQAYIWVDETERYEDFAVKSTIYQFNGLWQNVELEKGKTYEYGFYAKGSRNTNRIYFNPAWDSSSAKKPLVQTSTESINFDLTTDWKFYSFRFTVNETGWSQCRVEKDEYNNGIKLSICGMYLKEVKNNQQTPLKWSPSIEDLQGHSLTANLRFEGRYVNSITTNVKPYLDVYYDGQKITSGFNAQVKYKGGNSYDWSGFWTADVGTDGGITNLDWGNREQNGTPLEVIVLVTYKGLNTVVNERMENVPDVTEIKETVKKYKIFESTLDRFNSTIGQVREQVVNGNRNYITNSGNLSDKPWYGWDTWEKTIQNGTVVFTKIKSSGAIGFNLGLSERVKDEFQNETMTWGIDIRASREVTFGAVGFETNGQKSVDVTQNWQRITHTFVNKFSQWYLFTFYNPNINFNVGDKVYVRFPKLEKGNVATEWTVAPEDVNLLKETTESSIEQTNRNLELKVSKDNVIASINASVETTGTGRNQGVVKINADKVDISGVLRAYTGEIGGFRIGYNPNGDDFWLTGANNFDCGINPGFNAGTRGAQLWAAWGSDWTNPGSNAWWVNAQGVMTCKATPVFYSGIRVPHGVVHYNNGTYTYSPNIKKIYMEKGNGQTWIKYYIGTVGPKDDEIAQYWNYVTMSASDKRYKSNIKPTEVNGLEIINNLKCYDYDIKLPHEKEKHINCGIMAQDVEIHMNEAHLVYPNGIQSYTPFEMQPYLIKAIQELSTENQQLKSQLNEMNERLTKLEDKINGNI